MNSMNDVCDAQSSIRHDVITMVCLITKDRQMLITLWLSLNTLLILETSFLHLLLIIILYSFILKITYDLKKAFIFARVRVSHKNKPNKHHEVQTGAKELVPLRADGIMAEEGESVSDKQREWV